MVDNFSVGGISTSIPSDTPIAGESHTLECSAGGSEGTFQWLKGPPDGRTPVIENSPRVTITSNAASSQLQFRPVQQSDNGTYSCGVTVNGSTSFSDSLAKYHHQWYSHVIIYYVHDAIILFLIFFSSPCVSPD